jgi:MFS family permease
VTSDLASSDLSSPPRAPISNARIIVVFFGILLGATLSGLDASIVATAAPTIIGDLGNVSLLPWLTTSYLVAQVSIMAVFGKLGDIYGRRRMFSIAITIFLIASVLCGLAQSMTMLIAFRVLQGVGAGGITGIAMALVADLVPSDRLGRYLGYTGLVFAGTSVIGPFAGGFFVDHFSWRFAFLVNVPSGLLCLALIATTPIIGVRVKHRVDYAGAIMLALSISSLLLALSGRGSDSSWTSPRIVILLIAFISLGAGFLWWESRAPEPILPLRILKSRVTSLSTLANLISGVAFTCGIIYPPLFFQAVAGFNAQNSGLLLAPFALTCAASTLFAGQIADRFGGHKVIPLFGMVCEALGFLLLSTISATTSASTVMAYGMLAGLGVGCVMQTLLYVVQRFSRASDMGVATSTVMLARVMGSSLGVAILGSVFTSTLIAEVHRRVPGFAVADIQGTPGRVASLADDVRIQLQESFATGLSAAFRVAVPIMVLGVVVVALIPGRRVREQLAREPEEVSLVDTAAHAL